MRDRLSRLEAEKGRGASPPYVWVWGWQTYAEALEAFNRDLPDGLAPVTADDVTFIRCGSAKEAA
jgi:hypothetical protein